MKNAIYFGLICLILLFCIGLGSANTASGFSKIKVLNSSIKYEGNTLSFTIMNGAGTRVDDLSVTATEDGSPCSPRYVYSELGAGDVAAVTFTCSTKAWKESFSVDVTIKYTQTVVGTSIQHQEMGTVYGTADIPPGPTTTLRRRYFSLSYSPEQPLAGNCITLKVTDRSTGDIVMDADVDVYRNGIKVFYGITDSNGLFVFCPRLIGTYEVRVDKTRYKEYVETITVGTGVTTTTIGTCYDSDGGKNYYTYGYVRDRYGNYNYDQCEYDSQLHKYLLYEAFCDSDGDPAGLLVECPNGYCSEGKCNSYTSTTSTTVPKTTTTLPATTTTTIVIPSENKIYVYPATKIVQLGDTFTMDVGINYRTINCDLSECDDVYGVQLGINFNPNVLSAVSVTEGDFLKIGGTSTFFIPGSIDNSNGEIKNVAITRLQQGIGITGEGTLMRVTFKAKDTVVLSQTSDISLTNLKVLTSKNKDIKNQFSITNAVVSVQEGRLDGDVNGDCSVDIEDLMAVAKVYGCDCGNSCYDRDADLNNDCSVDITDLSIVAQNFGKSCGIVTTVSLTTTTIATTTTTTITGTERATVGKIVTLDYLGKFENGTVFDTSIEDEAKNAGIYVSGREYKPFSFSVGTGQVIQGFDEAILGMKAGEEKEFTIPSAKGYTSGPLSGKTLIFHVWVRNVAEPVKIPMTVVNDPTCDSCDTSYILAVTENLFPGVQVTNVDSNSDEGKALIDEYGIIYLPAYIFDEALATDPNYASQAEDFEKVSDKYLLKTSATGAVYPVKYTPELDAFLVSNCPYGLQMQRVLIPVINALGSAADIKIRYLGSIVNNKITSMHGDNEAQENLRQICIREEQTDKFVPYLACYIQVGKTDDCLNEANVDKTKLTMCMTDTAKGIVYAKEDFALQAKYSVSGSPTLILNGEKVNEFDFGGRSAEAVKTMICSKFNTKPDACSKTLDTRQAATSFSKEYYSG